MEQSDHLSIVPTSLEMRIAEQMTNVEGGSCCAATLRNLVLQNTQRCRELLDEANARRQEETPRA